MHTVVTMSMPAPGVGSEVRSEVWAKVPNLVYMKMNMPGTGAIEMGYDGEIAWTMSAVTGPMIHDDIPEQLLEAVDFAAVPFEGLAVTYVGRRQIGGRSLDAVRAIMPDSSRVTHYFDVATGLIAGMDPTTHHPLRRIG